MPASRAILPDPFNDSLLALKSGRSSPVSATSAVQPWPFVESYPKVMSARFILTGISVVNGNSTALPSGAAICPVRLNRSGKPSAANIKAPFRRKDLAATSSVARSSRPSGQRCPLTFRATELPKNLAYAGKNSGAKSPAKSALKAVAPSACPVSCALPTNRSTASVDSAISAAKSEIGPVPCTIKAAEGNPGNPSRVAATPPASSLACKSIVSSFAVFEYPAFSSSLPAGPESVRSISRLPCPSPPAKDNDASIRPSIIVPKMGAPKTMRSAATLSICTETGNSGSAKLPASALGAAVSAAGRRSRIISPAVNWLTVT